MSLCSELEQEIYDLRAEVKRLKRDEEGVCRAAGERLAAAEAEVTRLKRNNGWKDRRAHEVIILGLSAIGGAEHLSRMCECDPDVGHCPCQYCAEFDAMHEGLRQLSRAEAAEAEVKRLREALEEFKAALCRSPYDISPCMECGEPVVCIPDGLPCCDDCAAVKEADKERGA